MKTISLLIAALLVLAPVWAQETEEKEKDTPVSSPWEHGILIDDQTTLVPYKNTLEFIIQHKFGPMTNGFSDLFGIMAPGANVRLALNYVILDNVMVGYGLTKENMTSDFSAKWAVLQQTERNRIPLALTVYGNLGLDGRPEEELGEEYTFTSRFSYFGQVIVGRKFTKWLTVQLNASFTHYNIVPENYDHDKIAFGGAARMKFSPQSSFIVTYNDPLNSASLSKPENPVLPKPNLAFGWEISTFTHVFQIYVGTAKGLLPQANVAFNQNDWTKGDLMFGFTINRLWGF